MGELAKRLFSGAGHVASTTITPGAQALLIYLGVPPASATVAAAFVGASVQEFANIAALAWVDRADRANRFVEQVEAACNAPFVQVLEEAGQDAAFRDLLGATADVALQSRHEWKIDALARIVASGVRDDAAVDRGIILTDALQSIEPVHLRVLQILSTPGPIPVALTTAEGEREDVYPWTTENIRQEDPAVGDILDALTSKLLGLGLIYNWAEGRWDSRARWELTSFGVECMNYLQKFGTDG